jgi:excisionase family DNA binding protein
MYRWPTRLPRSASPSEPTPLSRSKHGGRARSAQLPRLVDIGEVADHLGVSVRHVRRLVAERRIPYVKWGHLLRFDPLEVSSWLALRTVDPLVHGRRERQAI